MKKLLLVFATLLAISSVVSGKLWLDLRSERQTSLELGSQLAESASIPRPLPVPATPAPSVESAAPPAVPDAPVAAARPAPPPIESEVFARATSAAISAGVTSATGGIVSEMELMKDPEYRMAQLT